MRSSNPGFPISPSRLTLHSCRIVLQEINGVKVKVNLRIIQIVGLRLLCRRSGFVQTVDAARRS